MCKAHTWPMLVRGDKRLFAQRQRRDHKMTKHRLVYIYIYRLKWTSRSSMHYRCSTRWSNLSQGSHMENKKQHANFPALQGLTHSGDTRLDNRSEVLSKQKKLMHETQERVKTLYNATKQMHYKELHLANCSRGGKDFWTPTTKCK